MSDVPAILGGAPVRAAKPWPSWPQWGDAERAGLLATLDSAQWWQGDGSACERFAAEFAAYQGAVHGLALTNGTQTLEAALAACDVGEGDEVIIPSLTFVATATAVLAVNATPVIVDIEPGSLNIDVEAAEAAITDRTRAIIAVHVAGAACDLDALTDLVARRGLHLIEDCAHAHGTFWRGQGAGSFGSFGSFSFQQSKLMTAGEGGALLTSDADLRDRAASYVNCGRENGGWFYHHPTYGTNMRMTEWQGTILSAQLARFPEQNQRRNRNAVALNDALTEIDGLRPQTRDKRMDSQGNYCFVFHYDAQQFAGLSLSDFEQAMSAEGILMSVSYPPIHELELFQRGAFAPRLRASAPSIDYARLSLANAEHAARSTVWLQHRMLLAEVDDVLDIARAAERIKLHAHKVAETARPT